MQQVTSQAPLNDRPQSDGGHPHDELQADDDASSTAASMDPRQVLLTTQPVLAQRSFFHSLIAATGFRAVTKRGIGATNEVRSSKYTWLTFIPKNLFEQFTRIANLYFLLMAGLQLIPGLSPTEWFTTVFPLVVVLAVNAAKEAIDDIARHRSDNEINERKVLLLSRNNVEAPEAWRDIMCGHVIRIRQDEEIPADCVLLATSDEEHICHIETANLDGETNLKIKNAYSGTNTAHNADALMDFEARFAVQTEHPTPSLYTFDGAVVERGFPDHSQPLTIDNLLLRGTVLRKTSWAIGLVVFAGADTKIQMNRVKAKRKVTQLEKHMNVLVIIMFSIMVGLSIFMGIGNVGYFSRYTGHWYLGFDDKWPDLDPNFVGFLIAVLRYIILLNGLIPISLYVTLEMVKVIQCIMVYNTDRHMYHADTDTPFKCRTTNLNEDLGQVEYVLSDKTGTLTQNLMGFVWASIDKRLYGKGCDQGFNPRLPGSVVHNLPPGKRAEAYKPSHVSARTPHSFIWDHELHQKLGQPFGQLACAGPVDPAAPNLNREEPDAAVADFFINLAVCNTVVPQILDNGSFVYQASSPDEEALVEGAAHAGYKLVSRNAQQVEVEYWGQRHVYKMLAILEFNSDRKRMSVICRCPDGKIRLFCKGADTVVMRLTKQGHPNSKSVLDHLKDMAQSGYRTLCIAQRDLTNEQWSTWFQSYHSASVAIDGREQKMADAAAKIESDLDLLGATAVEDKLQDGVPEAIASLLAANIKVWVLTGDKVETAISIAFSAKLFDEDMAIVELRDRNIEQALMVAGVQRSPNDVRQAGMGTMKDIVETEAGVFKAKIDEVQAENIRMDYESKMKSKGGRTTMTQRFSLSRRDTLATQAHSQYVGLVVEGGALAVGLLPEHQDAFMELCRRCRCVVFCRVSPMQKAAVTRLVQMKCGEEDAPGRKRDLTGEVIDEDTAYEEPTPVKAGFFSKVFKRKPRKSITLGIGDGANDVGMIQAAHIGVGISGREGRAAVLASDYSFAQFKYLARLLLVHGRSTYRRNTEVVHYSFYKNWVFNMALIYFGFVTGWSTQPLFTTGLIATLNLFWASLPTIVYAFTEQDVSQATLMANPALYVDSMSCTQSSFTKDWAGWLAIGTWHSLVVWFVPTYAMWTPNNKGRTPDFVSTGCTVYIAIVMVVNLKLALRTRYWTWLNHVVIWLSVALWFPFVWLYGLVWPVYQVRAAADMSDIHKVLYAEPTFWLGGFLVAPALSVLLDISIMAFRKHLAPMPHEILQEVEYLEDLKRQALKEIGVGGFANKSMQNTFRMDDTEMAVSKNITITHGQGGAYTMTDLAYEIEMQGKNGAAPREQSENGAGSDGVYRNNVAYNVNAAASSSSQYGSQYTPFAPGNKA